MRPRPTKEQFLPHAYDVRDCKGNPSSCHAALTCYAVTGKSITAIFTPTATLSTTYTPYGTVTTEGDITQPIRWSSEMYDTELSLVYYNYRYYNPTDGRWTRREPLNVSDSSRNLYLYCSNTPLYVSDIKGLLGAPGWEGAQAGSSWGTTRFNSSNIGINSCYSKCPANAHVRKRGNCCEYRTGRQKIGYTPSANGCGSEGGAISPDSGKGNITIAVLKGLIPQMYNFKGVFLYMPYVELFKMEYEFDFLEACNSHDICYGGCGNRKSECDKKFLQDMLDSCSRNQSPNTVSACKFIARIYYVGVYLRGGSAYREAQNEACEWETC